MTNLLIIDNAIENNSSLCEALIEFGIKIHIAKTMDEAQFLINKDTEYKMIIVNCSIPFGEYHHCLDRLYAAHCPLIYMPFKDKVLNTLLGLLADGTNYVLKPFVMEDMILMIKTYMRELASSKMSVGHTVLLGNIEMNTDSEEVFRNGDKLDLAPKEYKLLKFLADNEGKILTAEQIINCVWGIANGDVNMLRVAVRRLRLKLDSDGLYIQTIRGKGYKFMIPKQKVTAN